MGTFDCLVKIGLHLQKIGAGFDQPTSIPKVCLVTLSLGLYSSQFAQAHILLDSLRRIPSDRAEQQGYSCDESLMGD